MTCNGELKDRFSIIIARNLDEIRNNFIIGLRKIGYGFDEDMFVDVGIRCALTLNGKPITKKELIKYFWTAYINTFKSIRQFFTHIYFLDLYSKINSIQIYLLLFLSIQKRYSFSSLE